MVCSDVDDENMQVYKSNICCLIYYWYYWEKVKQLTQQEIKKEDKLLDICLLPFYSIKYFPQSEQTREEIGMVELLEKAIKKSQQKQNVP